MSDLAAHTVFVQGGPRVGAGKASDRVYRDLIEEAAALWESLSQNHPFIDGNKRVAVTATGAFLRVDGYRLEFTDAAAFAFLLDLYETGRMRFGELDAWLRMHTVPV